MQDTKPVAELFPFNHYLRAVFAILMFSYTEIASTVIDFFNCVHVGSEHLNFNYPAVRVGVLVVVC